MEEVQGWIRNELGVVSPAGCAAAVTGELSAALIGTEGIQPDLPVQPVLERCFLHQDTGGGSLSLGPSLIPGVWQPLMAVPETYQQREAPR